MSFSKSCNCTSRFGECNFASWKTHKCKLNPNWKRKTVWLLINNINVKKFAWRMFWTLRTLNSLLSFVRALNLRWFVPFLRHPGRVLDLKTIDLTGYLWTSLFIDQWECLLYYLFLHSITSFLHCVKEKLHCSQPIRIEKFLHVYY